MKNKWIYRMVVSFLVAGMVTLTSCGEQVDSSSASGSTHNDNGTVDGVVTYGENTEAVNVLELSDMFTDRDLSGEYKLSESVNIELNGDSVQCNAKEVHIEGSTITITAAGIYVLSGTLENGSIVVAADNDDAKVQLVLNNAEINNMSGAAIYVKSCDKVFVTTEANSSNVLESSGNYEVSDENNIDGVVFSKSDICFNGSGELMITAMTGHGVVTKDDLKITGGNIMVNAPEGHGFSGKDSVRIADGNIIINCGKDGIHSENEEDAAKGYIYIGGGNIDIISGGDGVAASGKVQVDTVELKAHVGGGNTNMIIAMDENGDEISCKGIKSAQDMVLNDGTYIIDSQDDALHSNTNLTVNGGIYELATGDDGLHADETATVAGGTIQITTSYEGIEGNKVYVSGGYVKMNSDDDGINAAGGNDSGRGGMFGSDRFAGSTDSVVEVSGGTIYMNAAGDGLDSNGSLTVTGGTVYISGPTNGANGALDYTTTGQAGGGTVVALGNSRMAMNFDDSSTQGCVLLTASGNVGAGTEILVKDTEGNIVIQYIAESTFNSILITSPELQLGETYTFHIGGSELVMTLETLINGSGSGMGGPGGMPGGMGGPGGMPDGMGGHDGERPGRK